jgi:cell division protease FtsH
MLEHAAPLILRQLFQEVKVLEAAWYLPEERNVRPDQMLDEMCATMGGRAAEEPLWNFYRCTSDLEK